GGGAVSTDRSSDGGADAADERDSGAAAGDGGDAGAAAAGADVDGVHRCGGGQLHAYCAEVPGCDGEDDSGGESRGGADAVADRAEAEDSAAGAVPGGGDRCGVGATHSCGEVGREPEPDSGAVWRDGAGV